MNTKKMLMFCGVILLASCASAPPPAPADPAADPVSKRIEESLQKASSEAPVSADTPRRAPVYSRDSCTIDYYGDAIILLRDIAKGLGWSASTSGPQPNLPIYVSVHAEGRPLKEVLAQVADQLGARADIVVRGGEIVLKYRDQ